MSKTKAPANSAAWFEIAVRNLDKASKFYGGVLGAELKREKMGPMDIAVFPYEGGMSGNLFEGGGAGGATPVVHLNAPKPLEDALDRVKTGGGKVVSDVHTIPGGRFAYCQDPDGTRFGLFTPA
jgi:uncharacterized protein